MRDEKTIKVYNREVEAYSRLVDTGEPENALKHFISLLPKDAFVLDLGCGPAMAANYMRDCGFRVDAVDASQEMVRFANETYDIGARVATFDEINEQAIYDGVWANFSLLHASRKDFTRHLRQIRQSLKEGGYFHIAVKLGAGEQRDKLGRYYTYYETDELMTLLVDADFEIVWDEKSHGTGLSGEIAAAIAIQVTTGKQNS